MWFEQNETPVPMDLFWLWLITSVVAGLVVAVYHRVRGSSRFTFLLDCGLTTTAMLAVVLTLYLSRYGKLSLMSLAPLLACSIGLVIGLAFLRQSTLLKNYVKLQTTLNQLEESQKLNHLILHTLPDLIWMKDVYGVFLMANPGLERLFNAPASRILGKTDFDFCPPDLATFFRQKDIEAMEKGVPSSNEEWLHFASNGESRLFETIKTPVHNKAGEVIGVMGVARDITDRHSVEIALKRSEERLRALGDNLPQGYIYQYGHRNDGQIFFHYLSAGAESIHGVNVQDVLVNAHTLLNQIDNTQLPAFLSAEQRSAADMSDFFFEARMVRQDGEVRWLQLRSRPKQLQSGDVVWDGIALDVTQQKQQEQRLQLAARVFSDAHEGIIITDTQYRIADVNPIFCEITGYERRELLGKPSTFFRSSDLGDVTLPNVRQSLFQRGFWTGDVQSVRKNGEAFIANVVISVVRDNHGEVSHYIGLISDVTQAKQQQKALEMMAHYDALTQLPNRVLFLDRFNYAIARCKRERSQLAVCYLDLDGFKQVNDKHGHEIGDQLLVEVAKRIQACLREEDTVSRIGGDEFALLLGNIRSVEQFEMGLKRIHQSICQPYLINDNILSVGASTGYTLYPEDDADPDTLLRHADQAMYHAKQDGRNCYCQFNLTQEHRFHEQKAFQERLRAALQSRELMLYYQPKVNMRTGSVVGFEALLRWQHPERGLLLPPEFLPTIIGTPLEQAIGEWVIEEALNQMDKWQRSGMELNVSVNISSRHLLQQDFQDRLTTALNRHSTLLAQRLEIEVLETAILDDINTTGKVIRNCRNLSGIDFTLDDFGSGYSSLSHLRQLPVGTIKIDQSFVRDMIEDREIYALIEGVIGLASAFNRKVVAEGVETVDQGIALLELGCELAQGFAIAHPMPAKSVPHWIEVYAQNSPWFTHLH